jgi:CHAT domain-containing protein
MNDQYRGFIADSGEISDLISLPETRGELEAISNYLGVDNGRNYFAEEATEFNLKSIDLSNINLISFATHALVSGELENLNEPGLILTPPSNPTMNDDGILTASEITKLDLSNTNFVILSACNTTAGSDSDAEELSGLSRAFFYSGANSILASHWPVVSEIAPMITVGIFKNLYESDYTITKSEAMRLSIMDYIKNSDEKLLHPSYWAAFSLIGG